MGPTSGISLLLFGMAKRRTGSQKSFRDRILRELLECVAFGVLDEKSVRGFAAALLRSVPKFPLDISTPGGG